MKKFTFLILFTFSYFFAFAQNEFSLRSFSAYNKYWKLDCSIGSNFNIPNSSSNPDSKLFYSRPESAPMVSFKITHLFSEKWGWNASVQINHFDEKKSEYSAQSPLGDFIEELFFDKLFWPVSVMHPAIEACLVYRIENQKWNIHPAIGIGYMCHLFDREATTTSINNDIKTVTIYKQNASIPYISLGISADYFVTKRCFLTLNTNYKQPVTKSSAELYQTIDGIESSRISYKTSSEGRNINVSLGFGFTFGRSKHKM